MQDFKIGDKIISKYGKGIIKRISGSKCLIEFEKPVLGSLIKMVNLDAIKKDTDN